MKFSADIVAVLLAVAGGVARYMQELLEGRRFVWVALLGHLFIGGFTGISMAKLAAIAGLGVDGQHLLSAWGGVVGLKAFDYIKTYLDKKLT